jgi:hypothetical protein
MLHFVCTFSNFRWDINELIGISVSAKGQTLEATSNGVTKVTRDAVLSGALPNSLIFYLEMIPLEGTMGDMTDTVCGKTVSVIEKKVQRCKSL